MPSKVYSGVYHAIHSRIGKREAFRWSSRITVNKVTFEHFVQGQYTLAKKCFSRNVMYILPMSDSSLWLLSKALDFWEIIILKSAPTLHLIYYAMFETLFFYSLRQFLMFIEWYCIKRLFSSTLCSFFIILRCDRDFWTAFCGGLFSAWFCCYRTEKVCGSIFLVESETETKEIHFQIVFGNLLFGNL